MAQQAPGIRYQDYHCVRTLINRHTLGGRGIESARGHKAAINGPEIFSANDSREKQRLEQQKATYQFQVEQEARRRREVCTIRRHTPPIVIG